VHASTYRAFHKNWIRNIRFSIINRPLSRWNRDFATEADAPRSSFCEKHNSCTASANEPHGRQSTLNSPAARNAQHSLDSLAKARVTWN